MINLVEWIKLGKMMLIIICVLLILICVAVAMLFILIKKEKHIKQNLLDQNQLEHKVQQLELNLQKTLEVMQDMAKNIHQQQLQLEKNNAKVQQVELQNLELVALVAESVKYKTQ